MSKLLINEQPLQVLPSLAQKIGLNEAIVLQQIHWLLNCSKHQINGRAWLYNTYEQWQENHFPFWSVETVKRTILSLEKQGLLLSTTSFNRMKVDKTKWYSIDYVVLMGLDYPTGDFTRPSGQNDPSSRSNCPDVTGQIDPTNNQEIIQENTTRDLLTPLPPSGESACADSEVAGEDFAKTQPKQTACKKSKQPEVNYQSIADLYNQANEQTGSRLPMVSTLNDRRKRAIKKFLAAIKQPTLACAEKYFEVFFDDLKPHHLGENDRGWRATFDFAIRDDIVLRVREGAL